MKKILVLFSIGIIVSTFFSCTKTGPAGPAGATGPTGASTIIAIDTFSVPIASWNQWQTNYYKFVHTNSKITQHVVDAGSVSVFVANQALYPGVWYAMPFTVAGTGQAGQRFTYSLNTITLLNENYTSGIPCVYQFKVVIYN
ncbi:MAG: hypothetical protein HYU69_15080 [Bacteroidetes bacterium]|nr:hypothetical protein [Bacteroidota bacterium]